MLCGYNRDTPDDRDFQFVESGVRSIGAAKTVMGGADRAHDYRDHDTPKIQLSNSCVGQSVVAAASLCAAIAGHPIAFPSALFAYAGARILDKAKEARLVDQGSSFRLAMQWLKMHGLIAEDRWPELAANVNAIPPLDTYEAGDESTVDAFYRIPDGASASGDCLLALSAGHCPLFGMTVDEKWANLGNEVYDSTGGTVLGGHAQVVIGYRPDVDAFIIRNTWGASWGDGGYGLLSTRFMNSSTFDKWVLTVAPRSVR